MATINIDTTVDIDYNDFLDEMEIIDIIDYLKDHGYEVKDKKLQNEDIFTFCNKVLNLLRERYTIYNQHDVFDAIKDIMSISTLPK